MTSNLWMQEHEQCIEHPYNLDPDLPIVKYLPHLLYHLLLFMCTFSHTHIHPPTFTPETHTFRYTHTVLCRVSMWCYN